MGFALDTTSRLKAGVDQSEGSKGEEKVGRKPL